MGARESELRVCLRNGFVGFGSRVESSVRYASCGSKKGRVGRSARNDRKTHSKNSRMQPDQIFRPFETDSQRRATADARFGSREEFPIKTIQIRSNIQSHQSINQSVSQSVGRAKNLLPFLRDSQSVSPLGPFFEVLRVRSFELVFVTNSSLLVNSLLEYTEFNHHVVRWNLTLATRSKSEDRTKRNTMLVHGKA